MACGSGISPSNSAFTNRALALSFAAKAGHTWIAMAARKQGRPSKYTEEIASTICRRLADGESLRGICADEAMPNKITVLRWLADPAKADFCAQYARAREAQADALVEECLEIADDGSNDWMERLSEAEK